MSGIGVITNPLSRENRRDPALVGQLGYVLGERGDLQQPGDLAALDEVSRRFHQRQIEILCVNGGDGTLHKAVTAMLRAYSGDPLPPIAVLRGGTMNTIAKGMGIVGRPADLLAYVVEAYHQEKELPTVQRTPLCVDGDNYGFLFGTGLLANYLELYYEGTWEPGPAKAAAVVARAALSAFVGGTYVRRMFRSFPGTVTWDGETLPFDEWHAVGAGTVDDIGLGFRPFYRCLEDPRKMHAVALRASAVQFVKELPRLYRARGFAAEGNCETTASRLQIHSTGAINYMLDGDFYTGGDSLDVGMGPTLSFVVPPK